MTNDSGKKLLTGYFKVWGTDGCTNEDHCGGRITLFAANTECISCDPESYTKEPLKVADCPNCERLEGKVQRRNEYRESLKLVIEQQKKQLEMCKEALEKAYEVGECACVMVVSECLKRLEKDAK